MADKGKSSVNAQPLKVFICISGQEFSFRSHNCFVGLMMGFFNNLQKYSIAGVSYGPSANRDLSRVMCFTRTYMDSKPLEGVDYDVMLNIDNDILYNFEQVQKLLDSCSSSQPLVLASYRMGEGDMSNVSRQSVDDTLNLKTMSLKTISGWLEENKDQPLMPVSHGALGLFAITKKAMDAIEYPYIDHSPVTARSGDKEVRELLSGDVVLCMKWKNAGFQPHVHSDVLVNKEVPHIV